ncbi:MAG: acetate/propionate family kinase, partial [Candidatus Binatia bacterium]
AAERIGLTGGRLWARDGNGETLEEIVRDFAQHADAVRSTFRTLARLQLPAPDAVGHRLVHGGPAHQAPQRINARLRAELKQLVPFAPLHPPSEIGAIDAVAAHFPRLPQVACFDTGFHARMPEIARRFPLPRQLWDEGVRRYGFHGLSYEYVAHTLGPSLQGRVVMAHLGNGASMAAVKDGRTLDTTMGFTPTGGFMMGTRCGDLDPGVLLHLMNEKGLDGHQLDQLVNHQAGLLGVSGLTSDMKTLLEHRGIQPHAAQAVEMFCYQARKTIGALSAVLEGLDTLVFTGGIGERAAPVRWEICRGLGYLGVRLDPQRNEVHCDTISASGSPCTVRVIPTQEDLTIARHTYALVFASAAGERP